MQRYEHAMAQDEVGYGEKDADSMDARGKGIGVKL